jgi:ribosomal protein L31E
LNKYYAGNRSAITIKIRYRFRQAPEAVQMVVNFIKLKLPESMHQSVDSAISSSENVEDLIKEASGKLGGIL